MSDVIVLDASAMLALIHAEPGADIVDATMPGALLCSVNLAEVISKLAERGVPPDRATAIACSLGARVVEFDAARAGMAGALRPLTRPWGLSLGDRCCLALAQQRKALVLTSERVWPEIAALVGLSIRNIRSG